VPIVAGVYACARRPAGDRARVPRLENRAAALETAHAALYLLFNEGHLSTDEEPIHRELCRAAMDLTQLIVDEPSLCTSDTLGLLALRPGSLGNFRVLCLNVVRPTETTTYP